MTATIVARPPYRLTLPRVVRAQIHAFLGGATAQWGLLSVLLLAVVIGAAVGLLGLPAGATIDMLPVLNLVLSFAAVGLQLFAIAVGSDAIAGEFTRGTIRASLTIVPRRGLLLGSNALTACGAVLATGVLTGLAAGGAMFGCAALLGHPINGQVIAAWLIGTVGLAFGAAVLALLTLALGTLTRQRLVAVLVPITTQYLLPFLVALFLGDSTHGWGYAILPSTAMTALTTTRIQDGIVTVGATLSDQAELPYWGALLVLGAWCVLLVPAAVVSFLRRDITAASARRAPTRTRAPERTTDPAAHRGRAHRATAVRLIASEWRKSWSLPSVRWIFVLATLALLVYGMVRSASGTLDHRGRTPTEALSNEFAYSITDGIGTVALLLAALTVIQVAGEFQTGTAVATFIAAPHRWQVTGSKLVTAALASITVTLPGMILAAALAVALYTGRGYLPTAEMIAAGAISTVKALLFVLLTAVMSAGIAGLTRRSVPTILAVAVLLVIGPALLNTAGGLATAMHSPLAPIGNLARFLPWEGARYFYPGDYSLAYAEVDDKGILHVSPEFGITVTAAWALIAVIAWFIVDTRRPIITH